MLRDCWSNAFGLLEQCFWRLKAMLLESESYAPGVWKQCFWMLGAMLLVSESYALGFWKQCSWSLKAMLKQFLVYSFKATSRSFKSCKASVQKARCAEQSYLSRFSCTTLAWQHCFGRWPSVQSPSEVQCSGAGVKLNYKIFFYDYSLFTFADNWLLTRRL